LTKQVNFTANISESEKRLHGIDPRWRPSKKHIYFLDDFFSEVKIKSFTKHKLTDKLLMIEEINKKRAREDSNSFFEYINQDGYNNKGGMLKQAWVHEEIQNELMKPQNVYIEVHRGAGKTTQIVAYIIWAIGVNPNVRIKLFCADEDAAKDRLKEVKDNIRNNKRVQRVFPHLKPSKKWNEKKIYVVRTKNYKDATVTAVGITTGFTGGRADIIIGDDVVSMKNALVNPKLRFVVKEIWDNDVENLLVPDGKIIYICTPWHYKDLSSEIKKDKAFKKMSYPISDDILTIIPEIWSREKLLAKSKKKLSFARGYLLKPLDEKSTMITKDNIEWYDNSDFDSLIEEHKDRLVWYNSYDLNIKKKGSGKGKTDFFAGTKGCYDTKTNILYVVDSYHAKLGLTQRVSAIEGDYNTLIEEGYTVGGTFVEAVAAQHTMVEVMKVFSSTKINVIPINTNIPKEVRVEVLSDLLANMNIKFNPELDTPIGGRGNLITEMTLFPVYGNDDMVDSLSQLVSKVHEIFLRIRNKSKIKARITRSKDDEKQKSREEKREKYREAHKIKKQKRYKDFFQ